jgi:23S rRNA (cytidine1920-2'-O)/16S rRNA (cytidine1409-2'-O)-methyltransferase
VRDLDAQADAIAQVLESSEERGWNYQGLTWSPLLGPAGNIEYLLWLKESLVECQPVGNRRPVLRQLTQAAYQELVQQPSTEAIPDSLA